MPHPTSPVVSVLMAVHNGEAYLTEAIDSLLAQTLSDFELVVVDDASTDGTAALLDAYAARDARLVVLRNERNLGLAAALNCGLERCRAPLIARADADDIYALERLERQLRYLNSHPEIGVLSTGYHRVDADGQLRRTVRPPTRDKYIRFRKLFMNSLLHPGVMFRASVVRAVGGYDPGYWTAQDSDLWARLRPHTRMANLPEPLVRYRVHGQSTMRSRGAEGQALSLSVPRRLLSEYLERPLDLNETRAAVTLFQGFEPMEPGDIALGLRGLEEVLRRARVVEDAETVQYYKREVGRALLRQAEYQKDGGGSASKSLVVAALRWSPGVVLWGRFYRGVAQAVLPRGTRSMLRAAR